VGLPRRPVDASACDVDADEYGRHLPRNGTGDFLIAAGDEQIKSVSPESQAELARCVLSQDAVASLVASSPAERYVTLLATTGLEIPDLKTRTAELLRRAKAEADAALQAAGLQPLSRASSDGRKHLLTALRASFTGRLPDNDDVHSLEVNLQDATAGAYAPRTWDEGERAAAALARADTAAAGMLVDPGDERMIDDAFDEAAVAVRKLASESQRLTRAIGRLRDRLSTRPSAPTPRRPEVAARGRRRSGLPSGVALRWLSHSRGLDEAAARFRADAADVEGTRWAERLTAYAAALEVAAQAAPLRDLEEIARTPELVEPTSVPALALEIPEELWREAGFITTPRNTARLEPLLQELERALAWQRDMLEALGAELAGHPARRFPEHAPRVLRAVCRFELARTLRREGPVLRASENLVRDLLQGRLKPVLRELVAAIVRFEWYFRPLEVPDRGRAVVFGGLSTSDPDLDARLVLNSAERSVVGLAWFLALHLLQPASRRRVLVLDDPTAVFDTVNQAGFVATLRAFVRLTRPEQVIVVSHDDAMAALLAEELVPVDGWPAAVSRIRCQRDAEDASTVSIAWSTRESCATAEEAIALGLPGEGAVVA
jgi:hypothetical protein